MGKLFDKSANLSDDSAGNKAPSGKPSPLMEGLGAGLTDGLDALDQSRQRINAGSRGSASFAAQQGYVRSPSTEFLTQARLRVSRPGSAFYGG